MSPSSSSLPTPRSTAPTIGMAGASITGAGGGHAPAASGDATARPTGAPRTRGVARRRPTAPPALVPKGRRGERGAGLIPIHGPTTFVLLHEGDGVATELRVGMLTAQQFADFRAGGLEVDDLEPTLFDVYGTPTPATLLTVHEATHGTRQLPLDLPATCPPEEAAQDPVAFEDAVADGDLLFWSEHTERFTDGRQWKAFVLALAPRGSTEDPLWGLDAFDPARIHPVWKEGLVVGYEYHDEFDTVHVFEPTDPDEQDVTVEDEVTTFWRKTPDGLDAVDEDLVWSEGAGGAPRRRAPRDA